MFSNSVLPTSRPDYLLELLLPWRSWPGRGAVLTSFNPGVRSCCPVFGPNDDNFSLTCHPHITLHGCVANIFFQLLRTCSFLVWKSRSDFSEIRICVRINIQMIRTSVSTSVAKTVRSFPAVGNELWVPDLLHPQALLTSLSSSGPSLRTPRRASYSATEGWCPGTSGDVWDPSATITCIHSSWLVVVFVVLCLLVF